ncbi:hypothetical protein [Mangrovihabitans endophyticus]|uniref:Uncharacterized protein n=1 Tax=Mangrovihabitans endophyticus TaxID=1751298 RepID=A0A8J3BZV1_9ACTN|nr:hypothetical protein [Mangrovihabitans endophyticus]GGK89211.1 hypothetical protein GCM10012284_24030 [Mangrovihabitans endophyticus]
MDAVYLVGPESEELRYSLRSLQNLPQVDRVVVAGRTPSWLCGVEHLAPVPDRPGKHWSTWANLRAAAACPDVSDRFVLMNDDFFALQPVEEIPVWHRGPVGDHLANHRATGNAKMAGRRMDTLDMLEAIGVPGRLDYELHTPMVMDKAVLAEVIGRADRVRTVKSEPVGKRTLYGNAAVVGGEVHADVKIRWFRDVPADGDLFVSTSDHTWSTGAVGRWLRRRFGQPCRYEREG